MRLLTTALLALMLISCAATDGTQQEEEFAEVRIDTTSAEARMWSREGFEVQPRMEAYRAQVPSERGFEPRTTSWQPASLEAADLSGSAPGVLLARFAEAYGQAGSLGQDLWEQTLRVWQDEEDRAVGVIMNWGLLDDAVIGHDLRVSMQHEEGRWYIEHVEERYHCARGMTDEGLCL